MFGLAKHLRLWPCGCIFMCGSEPGVLSVLRMVILYLQCFTGDINSSVMGLSCPRDPCISGYAIYINRSMMCRCVYTFARLSHCVLHIDVPIVRRQPHPFSVCLKGHYAAVVRFRIQIVHGEVVDSEVTILALKANTLHGSGNQKLDAGLRRLFRTVHREFVAAV